MIRKAEAADFAGLAPDTEAAVRVLCLRQAYGTETSFVHFWCLTEGNGPVGFLSLLDGAAVLALPKEEPLPEAATDELEEFLRMQPDVRTLHAPESVGARLAGSGRWGREIGRILQPGERLRQPPRIPEPLSPREVYPVLKACFESEMPPFSPWYVDVSHRVRHGCCRIVGFRENGRPTACAMTTAECGGAAIVGAVATLPESRGKGYASGSVLSLTRILLGEGRRVYLLPKNERAHRLYTSLGFRESGRWAGLKARNP